MSRAGNGQKSFAELDNIQGQGSFDNNYLNVLKVKGPKRRDRLSIRSGNRRAGIPQQEIAARVGTQPDNKTIRDPE